MKAGKEATAVLTQRLFESDKALVLSAMSWLVDFMELQLSLHKTWLATRQAQAAGAGVLTGTRLLVDYAIRSQVSKAFQYLMKHYMAIRAENKGKDVSGLGWSWCRHTRQ
jgi:hypothetical protein